MRGAHHLAQRRLKGVHLFIYPHLTHKIPWSWNR